MISYEPFFKTLKDRGMTQYDLIYKHNVRNSLLDKLRTNKNITIFTLESLCEILNCEIQDIVKITVSNKKKNS